MEDKYKITYTDWTLSVQRMYKELGRAKEFFLKYKNKYNDIKLLELNKRGKWVKVNV